MKPLLTLLALAALSGCLGGRNDGPDSGPVQKIEGLSMFEMSRGSYTWGLDAAFAKIYEQEEKAYLTLPKMIFYRQGKIISKVRGKKGELITNTKDIDLKDDVVVESLVDGAILKSPSLHFSSASNKIWSTDKVTLYQGGTVVHGRGFTANPDLSEVVIEKQKTLLGSR